MIQDIVVVFCKNRRALATERARGRLLLPCKATPAPRVRIDPHRCDDGRDSSGEQKLHDTAPYSAPVVSTRAKRERATRCFYWTCMIQPLPILSKRTPHVSLPPLAINTSILYLLRYANYHVLYSFFSFPSVLFFFIIH